MCSTKNKKEGKYTQNQVNIYSGAATENRAKEAVASLILEKYQNQIKECQYVSERIITTKTRMFPLPPY